MQKTFSWVFSQWSRLPRLWVMLRTILNGMSPICPSLPVRACSRSSELRIEQFERSGVASRYL